MGHALSLAFASLLAQEFCIVEERCRLAIAVLHVVEELYRVTVMLVGLFNMSLSMPQSGLIEDKECLTAIEMDGVDERACLSKMEFR